jgi:UPF0755 protein
MVKSKYRTSLRFLIVLALLAIIPVYGWWAFSRSGPLAEEAKLLVKKGMTVNQAADSLYRQGIIRDKTLFRFWARAVKLKLMRGEYVFSSKISMADVAKKLVRGETHVTKVVITPALHGWAVQKRLEPFIPPDIFWELWINPELAKIAGFPNAPSLEGLIASATYSLNLAMEPEEIMLLMVETFHEQVLPALQGGVLPPYETLILASLAEKETNLQSELSHVTGVYNNRLNMRMRLQCDPTSLYARWLSGDLRFTPPTHEDTSRSHPYNTYSMMGLPPGPIAIPSKAAIEAAKDPMETDAIFFVATGKGGHNFSRTLNEHNRNVSVYRKEINKRRKPK